MSQEDLVLGELLDAYFESWTANSLQESLYNVYNNSIMKLDWSSTFHAQKNELTRMLFVLLIALLVDFKLIQNRYNNLSLTGKYCTSLDRHRGAPLPLVSSIGTIERYCVVVNNSENYGYYTYQVLILVTKIFNNQDYNQESLHDISPEFKQNIIILFYGILIERLLYTHKNATNNKQILATETAIFITLVDFFNKYVILLKSNTTNRYWKKFQEYVTIQFICPKSFMDNEKCTRFFKILQFNYPLELFLDANLISITDKCIQKEFFTPIYSISNLFNTVECLNQAKLKNSPFSLKSYISSVMYGTLIIGSTTGTLEYGFNYLQSLVGFGTSPFSFTDGTLQLLEKLAQKTSNSTNTPIPIVYLLTGLATLTGVYYLGKFVKHRVQNRLKTVAPYTYKKPDFFTFYKDIDNTGFIVNALPKQLFMQEARTLYPSFDIQKLVPPTKTSSLIYVTRNGTGNSYVYRKVHIPTLPVNTYSGGNKKHLSKNEEQDMTNILKFFELMQKGKGSATQELPIEMQLYIKKKLELEVKLGNNKQKGGSITPQYHLLQKYDDRIDDFTEADGYQQYLIQSASKKSTFVDTDDLVSLSIPITDIEHEAMIKCNFKNIDLLDTSTIDFSKHDIIQRSIEKDKYTNQIPQYIPNQIQTPQYTLPTSVGDGRGIQQIPQNPQYIQPIPEIQPTQLLQYIPNEVISSPSIDDQIESIKIKKLQQKPKRFTVPVKLKRKSTKKKSSGTRRKVARLKK
jgi:hypothetical protein